MNVTLNAGYNHDLVLDTDTLIVRYVAKRPSCVSGIWGTFNQFLDMLSHPYASVAKEMTEEGRRFLSGIHTPLRQIQGVNGTYYLQCRPCRS